MAGSSAIHVLNGMAAGLFSSLIIGLILKQLGGYTGIQLLSHLGSIAQYMMGPAIGAGVAISLRAPLTGCCFSTGLWSHWCGYRFSQCSAGNWRAGRSSGGGIGRYSCWFMALGPYPVEYDSGSCVCIDRWWRNRSESSSPVIAELMNATGAMINAMTHLHPIPMGILVSAKYGNFADTAGIQCGYRYFCWAYLGWQQGLQTVGCACHMIGFAVTSL